MNRAAVFPRGSRLVAFGVCCVDSRRFVSRCRCLQRCAQASGSPQCRTGPPLLAASGRRRLVRTVWKLLPSRDAPPPPRQGPELGRPETPMPVRPSGRRASGQHPGSRRPRGCRGPCRTAQPEADSQNKLNRGPAILAACFRPIRLPPVLYRASGNGRRLAGRNDHRPLDAQGRSRGRASGTHPGQFARVRCTTARGCPRVASHRLHHEPIARPRPDSAVEPVSAARIPRPGAPRQSAEVRKGTAEQCLIPSVN